MDPKNSQFTAPAYMALSQDDIGHQEQQKQASSNMPDVSPSYGYRSHQSTVMLDDEEDYDEDDLHVLTKGNGLNNLDPETAKFLRLDFTEKSIRAAFMRKVFSILMVQLLLTTGVIGLFCWTAQIKQWVQTNHWLLYVSMAITLGVMIAMVCSEGLRRRPPTNFILLGIFTLAEGVVVGTFATFFDEESVLIAAGITVAVCFALTLFSFQTKWDVTGSGGFLFVLIICLFLFGIIAIFIPGMQTVYAGLGALLFSAYLVYDIQMMMGGEHKYAISPEEYIFASLNIYLDIINLFIFILRLVGDRN